jgi:ribosomal protein S18 acetylase RimI-like enzyme
MLYEVRKKDIRRAAGVLTEAFRDDPIWTAVCEGEADVQKSLRAIFEMAVRFGLAYGKVLAPSNDLEGIVAWVPGEYDDMTFRQLFRSGGLWAAMRIGRTAAKRMGPAFKPITEYRKAHLKGRKHLYLLVFGVPSEHRGKGFGRQLISAAIADSERLGLPLYVGAGSDDNVALYEHFGFRIVEKIALPAVGLHDWEMVREPATQQG